MATATATAPNAASTSTGQPQSAATTAAAATSAPAPGATTATPVGGAGVAPVSNASPAAATMPGLGGCTDFPELTQALVSSQSSNLEERRRAEAYLNDAELKNFRSFVLRLTEEMTSSTRPPAVRQLAGIVLKNSIWGTDPALDGSKRERWISLPAVIAEDIRAKVLTSLVDPCDEARGAACQVIAKVGRLDVPSSRWPTLLPNLMRITLEEKLTPSAKQAALTALGYLCEDLGALSSFVRGGKLLQPDQTNLIMTAVCNSMQATLVEVVLAATKAFYHALPFAGESFSKKEEREFVLTLLGKCLDHSDSRVQLATWECVIQMLELYFLDLLAGVGGGSEQTYLKHLGDHSLGVIKRCISEASGKGGVGSSTTESVALAAIEFWSTICDIVLSGQLEKEDLTRAGDFVKSQNELLLPTLFEAMTKREAEEVDPDEWSLAMAAGTCVSLLAQIPDNQVLLPALQFVNLYFENADWRRREAAVFVYGSVMEGPANDELKDLIQQSVPHLCRALADKSLAVRETTAWAIGRIAASHTQCLLSLLGDPKNPGLISVLLNALEETPRVCSFVCYAIHEVIRNVKSCEQREGSGVVQTIQSQAPPSKVDIYFCQIANAMLKIAQATQDSNLRASALETLSELIGAASRPHSSPAVTEILVSLCEWLHRSFGYPATEEVCQLQALICGCLNNAIDHVEAIRVPVEQIDGGRIGLKGPTILQSLFEVFKAVIQISLKASNDTTADTINASDSGTTPVPSSSGTTQQTVSNATNSNKSASGSEEDAMLAIGSLIRAYEKDVGVVLPDLALLLNDGLQNPGKIQYCRACLGVLGELGSVLDLRVDQAALSTVGTFIPVLFKLSSDPQTPPPLKPLLLTTIGDLAVAMEGGFDRHLNDFLLLLQRAAATKITDVPSEDEWIEYFHDLRESVLEAYISLIHAMRRDPTKLRNHVHNWLSLIRAVIEDPTTTSGCLSKAIEALGDLVTTFRGELVNHLTSQIYYKTLVEKARDSDDAELKKSVSFLQKAVARCGMK